MPALQFPAHFPPTTRFKKFFIGVRWLGPDLSFFKQLKADQAARGNSDMAVWQDGERLQLALSISKIVASTLGWKSPFFLPNDSADVVFHGPRFDFNDPEAAIEGIEEMFLARFGVPIPESLWREAVDVTMGELVDRLLALLPKT
jgi:hypothetical protein